MAKILLVFCSHHMRLDASFSWGVGTRAGLQTDAQSVSALLAFELQEC